MRMEAQVLAMVVAKLAYRSPRLTVLGAAQDVPLSQASPAMRQAIRELQGLAASRRESAAADGGERRRGAVRAGH